MTINERIREQGVVYDSDLPPSIPAGEALRRPRSGGRPRAERGMLQRSCARAMASLRRRQGIDG